MNIAQSIKSVPFFAGIDSKSLEALSKISRRVKLNKEGLIFSEGDDANALYILLSGSVDLIKSSSGGKEEFIRNVKDGETFAEAAMFEGGEYPVSAIAKIDSEVLVIPKERFLKFITVHPDASLKMMGAMAKLLRHLNAKVGELSLGSVSSRLADYILKEVKRSGKNEFRLRISKRELAFKLSTIPETLSRTLKKLQNEGIIKVEKDRIVVKKSEKLKIQNL